MAKADQMRLVGRGPIKISVFLREAYAKFFEADVNPDDYNSWARGKQKTTTASKGAIEEIEKLNFIQDQVELALTKGRIRASAYLGEVGTFPEIDKAVAAWQADVAAAKASIPEFERFEALSLEESEESEALCDEHARKHADVYRKLWEIEDLDENHSSLIPPLAPGN